MATSEDVFDWHFTQALYHVRAAVHVALGDHKVGLSKAESKILEEAQTQLEKLEIARK